METLSNVEVREANSVVSDVLPEAKSLEKGVSVRYVPTIGCYWYVLRASYGREDVAADYIISDGVYAYVAKRVVVREVGGRRERVLESLIPNLLFVYTTAIRVEQYVKDTPYHSSYLSYYYNHFEKVGDRNPPLIVPERQMQSFILATCMGSEHVRMVQPSQCHFKGGDLVRVIEGAFRGVEGRVARVAGQQRVVVDLTGIGLVATAYIPGAFLQHIL